MRHRPSETLCAGEDYWRRLLLVAICSCSLFIVDVDAGPHEDTIIRRIFHDNHYYQSSRPVKNENSAIEVKFGLSLQQIIEVDEKNEMIHTNMWLNYEWKDYKLSWNESEFDGVKSIRLPSKDIWTPDILMYNSADEDIDSKFPTNIVVYSDGTCSWVPLGLYISSCPIDITWFPFDDQNCTMKFGSWTYDGGKINLTARSDTINIDTYQLNGEWKLLEVPAYRHEVLYECCPDPYIDITFVIHIRRLSLYYSFNLIIPCAFISLLALFTFVLPPDEGEKIGLGITILLSLTVFQLIVAERVPSTSLATPIISVYFSLNMFMCALSLIMTIVVLNLHHRSPEMYEMPDWVRVVICEWLAWLVRIKRPGRELSLDELRRRRRVRQLEALIPPSASLISNIKDIDNTIPLSSRADNVEAPPAATDSGCPPYQFAATGPLYFGFDPSSVSDNAELRSDPAVLVATLCGLRAELLAILNELRWITSKLKDDAEEGSVTSDWKFVAMVVDRLCLWVFTFYYVVGSIIVFMRAPNIF